MGERQVGFQVRCRSKGQGEEMRAGRTRSWAVGVRWGLPDPGCWGREPVDGGEWHEDD